MNCKVILNINGIETTSSIMLEDGFDKNDAVIQIKRKLQSILDKDSIKESEKDSLYYAALNIYNDVSQKIQNQKSLKDNFKESYTFNSIYDVPELYFPNEFKQILKQFSGDFPNFASNSPIVQINISDKSIKQAPPYYDSEANTIYINLGKKDNPSVLIEPFIHEYVHYIFNSRLDLSDEKINDLYQDITKLLYDKKAKYRSDKNENLHLKVKEYLAESFTKVILDGYKFDEDQKQNLKSLLNNLDQNIKNKDEILFFNFISDQQFDSNDIQDRDIVNAIKYSKGVDSEKVQDALKKVYDRFDRNKLEYKGKADKTFVKYDSAFGEMRDLKDNSLSVLETHDIVYVKSEDDKYYDKYYPVIYTYFDDKADVQKFVTSVKKKDGTYTIQTFPANQIIGFRKSYGNVKFREVEDYELYEIDKVKKSL